MDYTKEGTTSVRVHHAPGGKSSFSLAWDTQPAKTSKQIKPNNPISQPISQPIAPHNMNIPPTTQPANTTAKTSVKVHNPPGGRSNIIFG